MNEAKLLNYKRNYVGELLKWLVVIFMMIEMIFYYTNYALYFNLSHFIMPLRFALVFGAVFLIRKRYDRYQITIILMLLVMSISMVVNHKNTQQSMLIPIVSGLLLLLEFSCIRFSKSQSNWLQFGYVAAGFIISCFILIVKTRYYADDPTRLTIMGKYRAIDPNYVALFLVAPFIICFKWTVGKLDDFFTKKLWLHILVRVCYAAISLVLAFGIFMTGSRGALVAVVAGAVVLLFTTKIFKTVKTLYVLGGVAVVVVALFFILPNSTTSRFLNIGSWLTDGSNTKRIRLWREALPLIELRPFLGYGAINSASIMKRVLDLSQPAHNTFLDLWIQGGVFYLFLFLFLNGQVLVSKKNKLAKALCVTTLVAIVFLGTEETLSFYLNFALAVNLAQMGEFDENKRNRSYI